MIGHLGARVSDLLDGRLTEADAERAWQHVHVCHQCRDLVEREGWVKCRLAGLGFPADPVPASLQGTLLDPDLMLTPGDTFLTAPARSVLRTSLATASGGALGIAALGLIALVAAPGSGPERPFERRGPATVRDSGPAPAQIGRVTHRNEDHSGSSVGRLSHIQDTMVW